MGFFSNWPFSNLHNLNLDWIVDQVKKLTVLSDQIWERVKPFEGGDPGTITPAQAYTTAILAQSTANQANNSAKAADTSIKQHKSDYNNPHNVTASQIGAAPAFDILPVAKGGTGSSNAADARASLGARADFTILPVSDGGTGSNTPDGACAALGAFPRAGGIVDGYIDFGSQSNGLTWTTSDGTIIRLRPYAPTNVFQITLTKPGASEISPFMMWADGVIMLDNVSIGRDRNKIWYWQLEDSSGFSFKVDGAEKCSLGFKSDGTITVNGKKIMTEE